MTLLLARILRRIRAPLEVSIFLRGVDQPINDVDTVHYHVGHRFVTVWTMWRATGWVGDGRWILTVSRYPTSRLSEVRREYGGDY